MSKLSACFLTIILLVSACKDARSKTESHFEKDSIKTNEAPLPAHSEEIVSSDSASLKLMIDDGLVRLDSLVGVQKSLKRKDAVLDRKVEDLKHRLDSLMTEMLTITHRYE